MSIMYITIRGKPRQAWRVVACFGTATDSSLSTALQMVEYARRSPSTADGAQQAIDVLKSGLSFTGPGLGRSRLLLALADVEAQRNNWSIVADTAEQALQNAVEHPAHMVDGQGAARHTALHAGHVCVSALLTQGADDIALHTARELVKTFEQRPDFGLLASCSRAVLLGALHATGHVKEASATAGAIIADGSEGGATSPACALNEVAWQAAQDPASSLEAFEAVAAAAAAHRAEAVSAGAAHVEGEQWAGEVQAAALLAAASAAATTRQWAQSEELASRALTAAEDVGTSTTPRVAGPLLVLGHVYSRTGRVTLAEGVLRSAASLLSASPSTTSSLGRPASCPAHVSLAAAVCWRYAQLLAALPKRDTEVNVWSSAAEDWWQRGGVFTENSNADSGASMELCMGSLYSLTGKEPLGSGVLVGLRRLLPLL